MLTSSNALRGIKCPDVLDGEPKLSVRPLDINQRVDGWVGRDEDRAKLLIFCTLHQRYGFAARSNRGLHKCKTAKPGQINLLVRQGFNRGCIVRYRREFNGHAELLLKVTDQGRRFACQFSG